jgi:AcrR family transcriptional regulator
MSVSVITPTYLAEEGMSIVNTYTAQMARWAPDSAERLQAAAIELFRENAFVDVTVKNIAERAGVTERTFFRYFATKEEVLFHDGPLILATIVAAVKDAPKKATPRQRLSAVADSLGDLFEVDRQYHRQRAEVIASEPALKERELLKQQEWLKPITQAMTSGGLPLRRAEILAAAATATFQSVYARWASDHGRIGLAQRLKQALHDLETDLQG